MIWGSSGGGRKCSPLNDVSKLHGCFFLHLKLFWKFTEGFCVVEVPELDFSSDFVLLLLLLLSSKKSVWLDSDYSSSDFLLNPSAKSSITSLMSSLSSSLSPTLKSSIAFFLFKMRRLHFFLPWDRTHYLS